VTESRISDGRVLLRGWRADDAAWYVAAVQDPEILRFTTESSGVTVEQVLAGMAKLHERQDWAGFAICDAAGGQPLGNIAVSKNGVAGEVSYWVAAEGRGRGVATAALRLLSAWAPAALGVTELRLWCHADNWPSRRVAENAGYRRASPRERIRQIKDQPWPTVDYVRDARQPMAPAGDDPAGSP
jgi:[ribosomal protein S5]-alanine N-acetyltransferase